MSEKMNLFLGYILSGLLIYFVANWALANTSDIAKLGGQINSSMTWKEILQNKSYCDYPRWREMAIRTGDISICK